MYNWDNNTFIGQKFYVNNDLSILPFFGLLKLLPFEMPLKIISIYSLSFLMYGIQYYDSIAKYIGFDFIRNNNYFNYHELFHLIQLIGDYYFIKKFK